MPAIIRNSAHINDRVVRVAPLLCPYCSRLVQAHDFEENDDGVRLICANCHADLITTERP